MCESCGCGDPILVSVDVREKILADNDAVAEHNRRHFQEARVRVINVMGSPGSGKTALLEATSRVAGPRLRLRALNGDLATEHDAQRLSKAGIPALTITTGSACHLDARLVHHALHHFDWQDADVLFIENVGNLVCPAIYDLGQAVNVVCLSVTEGEDKPLKYPVMFRKADLILLTKTDLLPHLDYDEQSLRDAVARVAPTAALLPVSARAGHIAQGIAEWLEWLLARPVPSTLDVASSVGEIRAHE